MNQNQTDNAFGYHIWLLNRLAQGHFSKVLAPLGIGPGQQVYLLAMQPGETLNQDKLAQRLNVDNANVTRALTALVKSGYIQRVRSSEDRRQLLVSLTEAGIQARQQVIEHAQAWVDCLKAPLSEAEWQQLSSLLNKVCSHQLASKTTSTRKKPIPVVR